MGYLVVREGVTGTGLPRVGRKGMQGMISLQMGYWESLAHRSAQLSGVAVPAVDIPQGLHEPRGSLLGNRRGPRHRLWRGGSSRQRSTPMGWRRGFAGAGPKGCIPARSIG